MRKDVVSSMVALVVALVLAGWAGVPASAGVLDVFSGLTGRTSNDAHVSSDDYAPQISEDLAFLRGKTIHLADFYNRAENTHQFSYPSQDERLFYVVGHGSVETYFWYCFQKALRAAGMTVLKDDNTLGAPSLKLKLKYLIDSRFVGVVTVAHDGSFFKKDITVAYTPPQTEDRDELAFHAYRFMDKIIKTVMTDPEVLEACGWSR